MYKKAICICVAALLTATMIFTACDGDNANKKPAQPSTSYTPTDDPNKVDETLDVDVNDILQTMPDKETEPSGETVVIPVQPDNTVVLPIQPDGSVVIPADPDGAEDTSGSTVTLPIQPDGTVVLPVQPDGSVVIPTDPDGSVDIPDVPGSTVVVPVQPDGSVILPVQPDGSVVIPTEPDSETATQPETTEPDSESNTQPETTAPSVEQPTETRPQYTVTLKDYEAMTPDQQLSYMNSFPSMTDYIAWLQWAQANDTEDGEHFEVGEDGTVVIPTNP